MALYGIARHALTRILLIHTNDTVVGPKRNNFLGNSRNSWRQLASQMSELFYKEDAFQLVGLCMQIHHELGKGHDEIIYKHAFVVERKSWQLT